MKTSMFCKFAVFLFLVGVVESTRAGLCFQNEPNEETLVKELERYERQYFGSRLEVEDSVFKDVIIRCSKNGEAIAIEHETNSTNPSHQGLRGGGWASSAFRVGFRTDSPDHGHGVLGDQRGLYSPFLFGYSDLDAQRLSSIFRSASEKSTLVREKNGNFVLTKSIDSLGIYSVEFEEYEAERYRPRSWTITKRRGDPIIAGTVKFMLGSKNKAGLTASAYDTANLVMSTIEIEEYDSQSRAVKILANFDIQPSNNPGNQYLLAGYPWRQRVVKCTPHNMSTTQVTFETIEIADKAKIDMYQGGGETNMPLGQGYQLASGKLVQVANAAAISAIENAKSFRQPEGEWRYYLMLGVPLVIVVLVLIWLRIRQ